MIRSVKTRKEIAHMCAVSPAWLMGEDSLTDQSVDWTVQEAA